MNDQASPRSNKRLWIAGAAVAVVIAALVIWIVFARISASPHTITVDGEPVVTLESRRDARAVLDQLRSSVSDKFPNQPVRFSQEVRYYRAAEGYKLAHGLDALGALEETVTLEVELFCIVVENEPIVGLASREAAEETLETVTDRYESKIQNREVDSSFRERVFIDRIFVDPGKGRTSVQEAVHTLASPMEDPTYHTIVRGDRVMHLARDYRVSFAELKMLNPGIDLDLIVEGDRLLIHQPKSPITVVSRAIVTKTVNIDPPPGASRRGSGTGRRQMEILEIYENGEKVSEEIRSQRTIWGNL